MHPLFWWNIRFPFSGDLTQDIAPETTWDLPFSGPYRGNKRLERKILADGAGYGEQLDAILEALGELIIEANMENKPACNALLLLKQKIETVKQQHYTSATDRAREALEVLKKEDAAAYEALLREINSQNS